MWMLLLGLALADTPTRAEQLASLRAEVEALDDALALQRQEADAEVRLKEAERAELTAALRAEEARLTGLKTELDRHREVLADASDDVLRAEVTRQLPRVRARIEGGLPFRTTERLEALGRIDTDLSEGTLSAEQAASRLWQFVDDELRLCRESALDATVIELDGSETLVELARVGMVALYYRTPTGEVGMWSQGAWMPLGGTDAAQVNDLVDALGKQVRTGPFSLPNPERTP